MPGRWLTPETIPATTRCRVLVIPDEPNIYGAVSGALLPLIYEHSWQAFGAVTPAAISQAMESMYNAFLNSGCIVQAEVDVFIHRENQNVQGGGILANTSTRVPFNFVDSSNANLVTLSGNIFTVPAGRWLIRLEHTFQCISGVFSRCWLSNNNPSVPIAMGTQAFAGASTLMWFTAEVIINSSASFVIDMYARATAARANDYFGAPMNVAGQFEHYGLATFLRLGDPI